MNTKSIAVLTALLLVPALLVVAGEGEEMIKAGAPFPEFELQAHDESTISSSDLEGTPYLVYFYPKADTPGCTREACELRDTWDDITAAGLKVFGVSFDKPKDNRAFAEKFNLPFLLLSDTGRSLADATGAAPKLLPFPKRISYLVGPDGVVIEAYPKVDPSTHARDVLDDYRTFIVSND